MIISTANTQNTRPDAIFSEGPLHWSILLTCIGTRNALILILNKLANSFHCFADTWALNFMKDSYYLKANSNQCPKCIG